MQVRISVLMVLAISMFTIPANAQTNFLFKPKERPKTEMCPQNLIPAGYKTWTRAGVAPLFPDVLDSPEKVHMLFAYDVTPEFLNAKEMEIWKSMSVLELTEFIQARRAAQKALALYLFTPTGTPKDQAPQMGPESFRRKLSEAMKPERLERVVIPCGTILNGMSFAATSVMIGSESHVDVEVDYNALVAAWYTPGVKDENGTPGFYAWKLRKDAPPVGIDEGDNVNKDVGPFVIIECGNVAFDLKPADTVAVTAPLPKEEIKPQLDLTKIPPPPDAPPASAAAAAEEEKTLDTSPRKSKFCLGPTSRWICGGLIGAAVAAWQWPDRGNGLPASAPNNTPVKKP